MPENKTPGPKTIIEKKKKYLIPCVYHFYKNPPHIVRGQGMYLYDSQGRQYMDFYSGVSVNALGHCHPEITDAICKQVKTLQHTTTIYLTEPIVNLAEQMAQILPGKLCRTFFCCSGSEANEGAAKRVSTVPRFVSSSVDPGRTVARIGHGRVVCAKLAFIVQ